MEALAENGCKEFLNECEGDRQSRSRNGSRYERHLRCTKGGFASTRMPAWRICGYRILQRQCRGFAQRARRCFR